MPSNTQASRQLINAIDPYLPAAIRNNSTLTLEDLIRSRVLVSLVMGAAILITISLITLLISWYFTREDFTIPLVLAIFCIVLIGLNYVYFYKTGRLDSAGELFSLTVFLLAVVSVVLTGGFDSPTLPSLACIPVIAFLVGGRQEGIYNAALAFSFVIVLLVLHSYEFPMMQLLPEQVRLYLSGIIWFVTFSVIIICLYVYDVLLEETRTTIVSNDPKK